VSSITSNVGQTRKEELTDQVLAYLEQDDSEYVENSSLVILHPGFYPESDAAMRGDFGLRDYAEYDRTLSTVLEESDNKEVCALYRSGELERTKDFLGERSEYIDSYIETCRISGLPTNSDLEEYSQLFQSTDQNPYIEICGELNGLCASQFRDSIKSIATEIDDKVKFETRELFPEVKLERTRGIIHPEGDPPIIGRRI